MILGSFFQKVKSILPDEVRAVIKEKSADEYCLLDVRQPGEYNQGHIPGATLIPLAELQSNLDQMQSKKMTVVYCRSGSRSRSAVGILNGAGFDDVYNMEGGILAYNGFVAAGPPEAGAFCFPENLIPEQLIAMAWYIEDGSQRYFDTINQITQKKDVRAILSSLTEYKIVHKKTLSKLYGKVSGKTAKDDFPSGVLQKPPKDIMSGCVSVMDAVNWSKDKGVPDILDFMMALEANTFDLYLKLGRQVRSSHARSVFMELSEEESRYLEKLASVFEKIL